MRKRPASQHPSAFGKMEKTSFTTPFGLFCFVRRVAKRWSNLLTDATGHSRSTTIQKYLRIRGRCGRKEHAGAGSHLGFAWNLHKPSEVWLQVEPRKSVSSVYEEENCWAAWSLRQASKQTWKNQSNPEDETTKNEERCPQAHREIGRPWPFHIEVYRAKSAFLQVVSSKNLVPMVWAVVEGLWTAEILPIELSSLDKPNTQGNFALIHFSFEHSSQRCIGRRKAKLSRQKAMPDLFRLRGTL